MKAEWKNVKPAHEKLWIWQKAHKLHLEICEICKFLPQHERYKLRSQVERSSKSVKDNIAEANESYYYSSKINRYFNARHEDAETQSHIREMESKKYIKGQRSQDMIDEYEEVKRGINGMIRSICKQREILGGKGPSKII